MEISNEIEETKKEVIATHLNYSKKTCNTCEMKDLCKFKDLVSTIHSGIKGIIPKKGVDDTNFINKYLQISIDCQRWRPDEVNRGKGII